MSRLIAFSSAVAFFALQKAQTASDYDTAVIYFMFSHAADVALCIFALFLVRGLSKRQVRTATKLALGG
jgi:hypothetical protein